MKKSLILLLASALLLYADVSKETFTKTKMAAGMLSTEMVLESEIRPNMKLENNLMSAEVSIVRTGTYTGNIIRLDKDLMWDVNHDKKLYSESPIRLTSPGSTEGYSGGNVSAKRDTTKEYRVVKSEFTVKKLDSTKTINGFPCSAYLATWTLVTEEVKTKEQSTSIMTIKEWTTPESDLIKQAKTQEEAFQQAYTAKLSMTSTPDQSKVLGTEYLATMGMNEKELADKVKSNAAELAKIQGYPIVTETKWEVQGDTTKLKRADRDEEVEEPGTPTSLGGLQNMLGNAIAKQIAPKPDESQAGVVFSSYMEIKSIKVGPTPDQDYEVPEGYKKETKKPEK
jgi:hypothetical protein